MVHGDPLHVAGMHSSQALAMLRAVRCLRCFKSTIGAGIGNLAYTRDTAGRCPAEPFDTTRVLAEQSVQRTEQYARSVVVKVP